MQSMPCFAYVNVYDWHETAGDISVAVLMAPCRELLGQSVVWDALSACRSGCTGGARSQDRRAGVTAFVVARLANRSIVTGAVMMTRRSHSRSLLSYRYGSQRLSWRDERPSSQSTDGHADHGVFRVRVAVHGPPAAGQLRLAIWRDVLCSVGIMIRAQQLPCARSVS